MKVKNISSDDFLELIQRGKEEELNHFSDLFVSRLNLYLKNVFRGDDSEIRDVTQSVYADIFENVKSGRIRGVNSILAYMITSARHRYLSVQKKKYQEVPLQYNYFSELKESQSTSELEEKEQREELLELCLEKMASDKSLFFAQVMKHINEKDRVTAKMLGISHQNFRTKKSRIVEILRQCVEDEKKKREE